MNKKCVPADGKIEDKLWLIYFNKVLLKEKIITESQFIKVGNIIHNM